MTKTHRRIQDAYAACYRLCQSSRDAEAWLTRSLDAARRGEVQHRKAGARFTHGQAAYKLPVADAARYFAVKWFLSAPDTFALHTFADACGLREDALYGLGARDHVRSLIDKVGPWQALRAEYADVVGLDYSWVFAA